jgi:hypothetical protein
MDRREFLKGIAPLGFFAMTPWSRVVLSAPTESGSVAWNYAGIPYPTAALPGISGNPNTIPVMPVLPNGAHFTGHDWFAGKLNSYDPCTITNPTPPSVVTENLWVVNKFDANATDSNEGDNAIGGVVYGTTARPRRTLPTPGSVPYSFPAGSQIFVYGDGTPRPTSSSTNRKVDYTQWENRRLTFNGTVSNPCWIVGIDHPRIATKDAYEGSSNQQIRDSTHLIIDGVVFEASANSSGRRGTMAYVNCSYVTFRNGAQHGDYTGAGMAHITPSNCSFFMYYNNEAAYIGLWDSTDSSTADAHVFRGAWQNRHVWIIENDLHHCSGDCIQNGNSISPSNSGYNDPAYRTHFTYMGGNELHEAGEQAIDMKNNYHFIGSGNNCHNAYGTKDATTLCTLGIDDEGPLTGYHWFINNRMHDAPGPAIRFGATEDGEVQGMIGNVIYDIGGSGVEHWNLGPNNTRYIVNNTIYNCIGDGIDAKITADQHAPTGRLYVDRNIIQGCMGTAIVGPSSDADWGVATARNNFTHDNGADSISGQWTEQADNSSSDPLMVDPDNRSFMLNSKSPACDIVATDHPVYGVFQGLYGEDIRVDYLGNSRPANGSWDAGAAEVAGGYVTKPNPPHLSVD